MGFLGQTAEKPIGRQHPMEKRMKKHQEYKIIKTQQKLALCQEQ
jgi:hypothetical protein